MTTDMTQKSATQTAVITARRGGQCMQPSLCSERPMRKEALDYVSAARRTLGR